MGHARFSRTPAPTPEIQTLSIRRLWRDAKMHYQFWAHSTERLDAQARLIMAGARSDTKTLQMLLEARERHWAELAPILDEMTRRIKAEKRKRGAKMPLPHDDDTHLYLSTAAQKITDAATKRDFKFEIK